VLRAGIAVLAALGVPTDQERVAAAALEIGSDVPALLDLAAHRVRGRGERLDPVPTPALHLVVVSTVPSSTAATYGALLPAEIADDGRSERLAELLAAGGAPTSGVMGSALEPAASRADPAVAAAVGRARSTTPEIEWHLTGSGGAVFTVAPHGVEAARIAAVVCDAGFNARACRTLG
jgi:4-diphosphocytidyl-2C-methyl-D-erythritol kinase